MGDHEMNISVLIPSFGRPVSLANCLAAIAGQTLAAAHVIVVARTDDDESSLVAASWRGRLPIETVGVCAPGQVHALNAGLSRCEDDIVAITDDDAEPRADWLARIKAHFLQDKWLGALGGRDWVWKGGIVDTGTHQVIGRLQWFGRIAGNHHLGAGHPRQVDFLKGANLAFRRIAIGPIGFDTRLLGSGAQVHNDMLACFAIKSAGWRIIYDPAIAVDHYPAARAEADRNAPPGATAMYNNGFNLQLAINLISRNKLRYAANIWASAIGTQAQPGIIWLFRLLPQHGRNALILWKASRAGRNAARQLRLKP